MSTETPVTPTPEVVAPAPVAAVVPVAPVAAVDPLATEAHPTISEPIETDGEKIPKKKPEKKPKGKGDKKKGKKKKKEKQPEGKPQGVRMRTSKEVLDRIKWDPTMPLDEFVIGYIDRFLGMQEMPVTEYEALVSYGSKDIPNHRIYYIKRKTGELEDIVWDRRDMKNPVDKVFGSVGVPETKRKSKKKAVVEDSQE